MRCEQARELLPAYLDGLLHTASALDVHLATCRECAELLAEYRGMLQELRALEDRGEAPPPELVDRILALIPPAGGVAARVLWSVQAHPLLYAASVGGAAVGATAVTWLWRRYRSMATA